MIEVLNCYVKVSNYYQSSSGGIVGYFALLHSRNTTLHIYNCVSDLYDSNMIGYNNGGIMGGWCGRTGIIKIHNNIVRIKFNTRTGGYSGIFGTFDNIAEDTNNTKKTIKGLMPEPYSKNSYIEIKGVYIIGGNYIGSTGPEKMDTPYKIGRGVIAAPTSDSDRDARKLATLDYIRRFSISNVYSLIFKRFSGKNEKIWGHLEVETFSRMI